jgi:hypothetical protein
MAPPSSGPGCFKENPMRLNILPPQSESGGIRFLRIMLLICVFLGVGWLYMQHFDRTIEDIKSRSTLQDATGLMTKAQKKHLYELSSMFEEEFGVELRLSIQDGPVEIPALDSKTMFFGLDTANEKLIVFFPPLVERALGPEFITQLQTTHMAPYFASDSWPTGLIKALALTWQRLIDLNHTTTP